MLFFEQCFIAEQRVDRHSYACFGSLSLNIASGSSALRLCRGLREGSWDAAGCGFARLLEMLSEIENSCIRLSQISDGIGRWSALPRGAALAGFGCGAGVGATVGRACCCILAAMRLTGCVSISSVT